MRPSVLVRVALLSVLAVAQRAAAQQSPPADTAHAADSATSDSIVTALGIVRSARSLGVAVQTLPGNALTGARTTNFETAVAGKVVAAYVSGTGVPGGSVRIVLRGEHSFTGDNQPLFVVDGIPIDNSAPRVTSLPGLSIGSVNYGNTVEDIDPNDIASITVLNGANAAALYGARAANGVILITTKTARGTHGFGVTARQYVTMETPLRLPAFQNRYGQGSGGQYSYSGTSANAATSWGPPLDGRGLVQWWSNGQPAPWLPQPSDLRDFLGTGRTLTTSAAVSAAGDHRDARLGITDMDQHGLTATNTLQRLNTALDGGATVFGRLDARAAFQYARQDGNDRPVTGLTNLNPAFAYLFGGRQLSDAHLRNYALIDGLQASPTPGFTNNPYWDVYANRNHDGRDHVIGIVSLAYAIRPWLSATLRSGTDWYHEHATMRDPPGNALLQFGYVGSTTLTHRENNTDLVLSAAPALGARTTIAMDVGAGMREEAGQQVDAGGEGSIGTPARYDGFQQSRSASSLYADARASYRGYLYGDVTGRYDHEQFPGSFFRTRSGLYPSASAGFVFTDALPGTRLGGLLSFGKIRASWAEVGGDAGLVPDHSTAWEAGIDLRVLHDRVSLGGTWYDDRTISELLIPVAPSNGVAYGIGAGSPLTSRGVELQVAITPIRRAQGLRWDVSLLFAKNRTRAGTLADSGTSFGGLNDVAVLARSGMPFGTFWVSIPRRDSAGQLVLLDGLPQFGPTLARGSDTPDWIGSVENHLHYRRFDLTVLVDTRQGGEIYSVTNLYGNENGVLASSLRGRQHGEALTDGGGLVVPGVNADGTPNTTMVTAQDYFAALASIPSAYLYSASFVKLREVRLSYDVPDALAAHLRLSSMRIALVGRNLWLHAAAPNIDPEASIDNGNAQGIEFLSVPSARSFGVMLRVQP